jgi:hypothetical protein
MVFNRISAAQITDPVLNRLLLDRINGRQIHFAFWIDSWVKNSLLCEIFVVEGKMIVEISVNFRSLHSENTIGLSGHERSF